MKRLLPVLTLVFAAVTASAEQFSARVTEVYTGDSMTVRELGGRETFVRLANINVPRRYDPFAARSRESLRALVKHRRVTIVPLSQAANGSLVAVVFIGEVDAGMDQVRRGLAWYAQDSDESVRDYIDAEDEAARERRGIWSKE